MSWLSSELHKLKNTFNNELGVWNGSTAAHDTALDVANQNEEYAKQNMALQYQYDMDAWNKQNEYNSPVAQMKRLSDAGLNPNMIYGSGSATGNSASAPSTPTAPTVTEATTGNSGLFGAINNIVGLVSSFTNITHMISSIVNLGASTANTEASTGNIRANTKSILENIKKTKAQEANLSWDNVIKQAMAKTAQIDANNRQGTYYGTFSKVYGPAVMQSLYDIGVDSVDGITEGSKFLGRTYMRDVQPTVSKFYNEDILPLFKRAFKAISNSSGPHRYFYRRLYK